MPVISFRTLTDSPTSVLEIGKNPGRWYGVGVMFQGYGCQDRIHHQRSARLAFFHTILQDRPMLIAWLKNAHERVLQPRVHNSFGLDDGKKGNSNFYQKDSRRFLRFLQLFVELFVVRSILTLNVS